MISTPTNGYWDEQLSTNVPGYPQKRGRLSTDAYEVRTLAWRGAGLARIDADVPVMEQLAVLFEGGAVRL